MSSFLNFVEKYFKTKTKILLRKSELKKVAPSISRLIVKLYN